MSKQDDGGPAFPQAKVTILAEDGTPNEAAAVTHGGMTLRDHYAGLAMQSFCSGATGMGEMDREEVARQFRMVADFAFILADQMVEARKA